MKTDKKASLLNSVKFWTAPTEVNSVTDYLPAIFIEY